VASTAFDVVFVDEAHHSRAKTWTKTYVPHKIIIRTDSKNGADELAGLPYRFSSPIQGGCRLVHYFAGPSSGPGDEDELINIFKPIDLTKSASLVNPVVIQTIQSIEQSVCAHII
jgi:hypothetical protein